MIEARALWSYLTAAAAKWANYVSAEHGAELGLSNDAGLLQTVVKMVNTEFMALLSRHYDE